MTTFFDISIEWNQVMYGCLMKFAVKCGREDLSERLFNVASEQPQAGAQRLVTRVSVVGVHRIVIVPGKWCTKLHMAHPICRHWLRKLETLIGIQGEIASSVFVVCTWPFWKVRNMMFIGQLAFCASGNKRLSIGCSMLSTLPDTIILYTDEHFDTTGILSVFPIAFCQGLTSILQQKANTTRAFVHCNNLSAPVSTFERRQTMLKPVCTTVSWMYAWATERRTWPKRSSRRSAADAVLELLPYYPLLFSIVFLWIRRCFRKTWWHWSLTTRSALQWT